VRDEMINKRILMLKDAVINTKLQCSTLKKGVSSDFLFRDTEQFNEFLKLDIFVEDLPDIMVLEPDEEIISELDFSMLSNID
jgi:hypothetical protein